MIRPRHRQAWATLAGLCLLCSGCQGLGTPPSLRGLWNKTTTTAPPASAAPALATEPLRPEQKANVQLALARAMENQGRTDEARKTLLAVIKACPRSSAAYHALALLHDRRGEGPTAESYYRHALRYDPQNAQLLSDFGYSLYLQQRWPEAETTLRAALVHDPEFSRAHNNLGLVLSRTEREAESLEEFRRAGCSEAEARANLAYALAVTSRWAEAHQQFQLALAANPHLGIAQEGARTMQTALAHRAAAGSTPTTAPPPSPRDATPAAYLGVR